MTPSPGVTALTEARDSLTKLVADWPANMDPKTHMGRSVHDAIERIDQGLAVLVQTETDLKECTKSGNAAHKLANTLGSAIEELYIRECVALDSLEERVRFLAEVRRTGIEPRTFNVTLETPRPTAAPQ